MSAGSGRWRLLAEGFVVVFSILAAFAVDAWWDGRRERVEEVELLRGLRAELVANRAALAEEIDTVTVARERLSRFVSLSASEAATIAPDSGYYAIVRLMHRSFTNELTYGFLRATVNSGKLALIHDPGVRAGLAEIESLEGNVDEVQRVLANLAESGTQAISRHPEALEAIRVRPTVHPVDGATLSAIRADLGVMAIVGGKLNYWGAYAAELAVLGTHLDQLIVDVSAALGQE